MQTRRRFVEDIERLARTPLRQFRREFDTLALAAAEACGRLA